MYITPLPSSLLCMAVVGLSSRCHVGISSRPPLPPFRRSHKRIIAVFSSAYTMMRLPTMTRPTLGRVNGLPIAYHGV